MARSISSSHTLDQNSMPCSATSSISLFIASMVIWGEAREGGRQGKERREERGRQAREGGRKRKEERGKGRKGRRQEDGSKGRKSGRQQDGGRGRREAREGKA